MTTKHPLDAKRSAETRTIGLIADRAILVYAKHDVRVDRLDVLMDLSACHFYAQRLRLDDLLAADDFNFLHDVGGISRHLDRENYVLNDFFSPRFSERAAVASC